MMYASNGMSRRCHSFSNLVSLDDDNNHHHPHPHQNHHSHYNHNLHHHHHSSHHHHHSHPNESKNQCLISLPAPLKLYSKPGLVQFCQYLGRGAFGEVYSGQYGFLKVAVKFYNRSKLQSHKPFLREVDCLIHVCDHPRIVSVLGFGLLHSHSNNNNNNNNNSSNSTNASVSSTTSLLSKSITSGNSFYMVSEYVGNRTLRNLISDYTFQQVELHERMRLCLELLEAVNHVHNCGCAHHDIKPENILISDTGAHVFLADFGMATIHHVHNSDFRKSGKGTINYASPESFCDEMCEKSDIWSLGVVFYEWLTNGELPFYGKSEYDLKSAIRYNEPNAFHERFLVPDKWQYVILHYMLNKDAEKRWTAKQIYECFTNNDSSILATDESSNDEMMTNDSGGTTTTVTTTTTSSSSSGGTNTLSSRLNIMVADVDLILNSTNSLQAMRQQLVMELDMEEQNQTTQTCSSMMTYNSGTRGRSGSGSSVTTSTSTSNFARPHLRMCASMNNLTSLTATATTTPITSNASTTTLFPCYRNKRRFIDTCLSTNQSFHQHQAMMTNNSGDSSSSSSSQNNTNCNNIIPDDNEDHAEEDEKDDHDRCYPSPRKRPRKALSMEDLILANVAKQM